MGKYPSSFLGRKKQKAKAVPSLADGLLTPSSNMKNSVWASLALSWVSASFPGFPTTFCSGLHSFSSFRPSESPKLGSGSLRFAFISHHLLYLRLFQVWASVCILSWTPKASCPPWHGNQRGNTAPLPFSAVWMGKEVRAGKMIWYLVGWWGGRGRRGSQGTDTRVPSVFVGWDYPKHALPPNSGHANILIHIWMHPELDCMVYAKHFLFFLCSFVKYLILNTNT